MTETAYRVLARKYRPATFADLVGQEAMVRTLRNAFEACCYVHVIAEYVPVIFNNITDIDTDPELNSIVRRYV